MKVINFLKTNNIIKVLPSDTLSHAVTKLSSSHDAAFVFDKGNDFLGVINPYHSLIKTSYPGNAKIEHCLFHPPKLSISYPIAKVATLMIESKIHYLPVFDDQNKFTGIVSARNLLAHFKDSKLFNIRIGEFLKTKNQALLTVFEDDLISQAINLFKSSKLSKLIVMNRDMKLKGILTYYDLISFLLTPKQREQKGDRVGTRVSFSYQRVKNFAKTYVLTLDSKDLLKDALHLILDKGIGSVVIVDPEKHPLGIITTRDLLSLIVKQRIAPRVELISRNLSAESRQIVSNFFGSIAAWIKKIPDITRATLFVKEEKRGGVFQAMLELIPKRGQMQVIKTEGKNLKKVLKKIKKD